MKSFKVIEPFQIIGTIFSSLGMWNREERWTLKKILHFVACPGFLMLGFFISMIIDLVNAKKVEDFTERLYVTLTMGTLITKLINFVVQRKKFTAFINNLQSPLVEPKTEEEKALFQNAFKDFNRIIYIFTVSVMGSMAGACLGSLLSSYEKLPFPGWLPLNWKNGGVQFWIAYTYQVLGIICSAAANTNFDFAHGYLFLQVSLYYRLVSMRLQKVGYERFKNEIFPNRDDSIEELKKCIKMHQFVTYLARCVQDIWSVSIFIQISVSGMVICITAFQLTILSPIADTGLYLSGFCYMGALIIQISLPCYYGNEIRIASGLVSTAVYSSNWTETSLEYKKLMFCFMESLKREKIIVAGGYVEVGLKTIVSVFQSAYSLFALLITMKD